MKLTKSLLRKIILQEIAQLRETDGEAMSLEQLKSRDVEAYEAYVKMIIDECEDQFDVVDGELTAYYDDGEHEELQELVWDPTMREWVEYESEE